MNIHRVHRKNTENRKATALEFYTIAYTRGLLAPPDEIDDFASLKKGEMGELKLLEYIEECGLSHWKILRNLWLSDGRSFECDVVVITKNCVYIFEVKNYVGNFSYREGACIFNNIKMDYDIIQQARKSFLKLHKICQDFSTSIPVKGALVFINERNQVTINSPVSDIDILPVTDVYQYINQMKVDEQARNYYPFNTAKLIQHLAQYEIANPFHPEAYSKVEMSRSRKGISCANCQSYDVRIEKFYVNCACGMHESKEEAIVRAACDYGVLTYDRNFTSGDIYRFLNYQITQKYIGKILTRHFKRSTNHSYKYFINENLTYNNRCQQFKFQFPKRLYLKDRSIEIVF